MKIMTRAASASTSRTRPIIRSSTACKAGGSRPTSTRRTLVALPGTGEFHTPKAQAELNSIKDCGPPRARRGLKYEGVSKQYSEPGDSVKRAAADIIGLKLQVQSSKLR